VLILFRSQQYVSKLAAAMGRDDCSGFPSCTANNKMIIMMIQLGSCQCKTYFNIVLRAQIVPIESWRDSDTFGQLDILEMRRAKYKIPNPIGP
jgi:hypothetical protein